jgi:hypothetical protein
MAVAKAESGAIHRLREVTAANGIKASEYIVAIQYLNSLKSLAIGVHSKVVLLPARSLNTIAEIFRYTRAAPRASGLLSGR